MTIEQARPPKTLRRTIAKMPSQPTVTPLEAHRLTNGLIRVEMPDGAAVLLQRIAPGGKFAAALLTERVIDKG